MSSMPLSEQFLKNTISDLKIFPGDHLEDAHISVDSRSLQKGDVFFALPGAVNDGHDFIGDALRKGASGIVIAKSEENRLSLYKDSLIGKWIFLVPNPQEALIKLATAWRKQFSYPVIGITGSVGKTSTKELLHRVLSDAGRVGIASSGNLNTLVGCALTILRMRDYHEYAIIEMGVSKRNEMVYIAQLVCPSTALITCVGHAHMEGIGTIIDIAAEKRMIFSSFSPESVGIINGDQTLLTNVSYPHPTIKFGTKTTNQIQARKVRFVGQNTELILKVYGKKYELTLPTNHPGAVQNSLAATAMAHYLKIDIEMILATLAKKLVVSARYEERPIKGGAGLIISDCYNANPESMKVALLAFHNMQTNAKKIAVLGDMLELGQTSSFWHSQLGRFLGKMPTIRHVVLVGDRVKSTKENMPINVTFDHVSNWQEAQEVLKKMVDANSVVLVKGSRGMGLDNLVDVMS